MYNGTVPYNPYSNSNLTPFQQGQVQQAQQNLNQALGAVSQPMQVFQSSYGTSRISAATGYPPSILSEREAPEDLIGMKRKEQIKALKRYLKNI